MHDSDEHSDVLCELPADVAASCIWDLVHYDFKQVPLFQHLQVPMQTFLDHVPDLDEGAKVWLPVSSLLFCISHPKTTPRRHHFLYL